MSRHLESVPNDVGADVVTDVIAAAVAELIRNAPPLPEGAKRAISALGNVKDKSFTSTSRRESADTGASDRNVA